MIKEELYQRMIQLDEIVSNMYPNSYFNCVIVGGSALLSLNQIDRSTLDVDVIESSKEIYEYFEMFDFNTKVKSLFCCFPINFMDRLIKININTKSINYFTPSIEDLIISKLYAYRQKDIDDIYDIIKTNSYDKKVLSELVEEARQSALNERQYQEMLYFYKKHFI